MTSTGLHVFDHTIQETNIWLKRVNERLGDDDRHRAYAVMRAVLHALRDRLNTGANAHLSAQLPMLVRGIYFEGWRPDHGELDRHKDEFLDRVKADLPAGMNIHAEGATRAVFAVIATMVDAGETTKVIRSLPAELRKLWPTH